MLASGSQTDSGFLHVSDPYPAPSVSLTVDKWQVDTTTGKVDYDLTMKAVGLGQVNGPCGGVRCKWGVTAYYKDGSTERVQNVLHSNSNSGGTQWVVGPQRLTTTAFSANEITDLRAYVMPYTCIAPCIYETAEKWVDVSDPYPAPSVSLTVDKWQVDTTTGKVDYDLTMKAVGLGQVNGPCDGVRCEWGIQAWHNDGSVANVRHGLLYNNNSGGTQWTVGPQRATATDFSANEVTHLRAYVRPYSASCPSPCSREMAETWKAVSNHVYKDHDLVALGGALAPVLARNPTFFCTRFLLRAGTHHLRSTLTDQYIACELAVWRCPKHHHRGSNQHFGCRWALIYRLGDPGTVSRPRSHCPGGAARLEGRNRLRAKYPRMER